MLASPALRLPAAGVAPAATPPPPAAPAPVAPVAPVAEAANPAAGREASLSDRPQDQPKAEPAGQPAAEDGAADAPVMALMRQAAALCRMANAGGGKGPADLGLATVQAQGGLEVRGDLVVRSEAGYRIGSGQIYQSGKLVAAFAGTSLALIGGTVSARM